MSLVHRLTPIAALLLLTSLSSASDPLDDLPDDLLDDLPGMTREEPAPKPAKEPPAKPVVKPASEGELKMLFGPYLQNMTDESVTIVWSADAPCAGVVEYGLSPKTLDQSTKAELHDPEDGRQQEATLSGLRPHTLYHYRVRSTPRDGRSPLIDEIGSFVTVDPTATTLNFSVIADTHDYVRAPDLAQRLLDDQPQLVWLVGDYNKMMTGLFPPYREVLRKWPIYFARGNHDHRYRQFVAMPGEGAERYYAVRRSGILFLAVDTEDRKRGGLEPGTEQFRWIEKQLRLSEDDWIFVMQHIPAYSAYKGELPELQTLCRLYEHYGVDVVFQGHQHHYDRSFPLKAKRAVTREQGGVVYLTASGACGGYEKFPFAHRHWFVAKQWRGAPFVVNVSVHGKKATIQAVTADGRLFDTLELKAR